MIDQTSAHIREIQDGLRRDIARRRSFHRMRDATDRLIRQLEEMNRDGVSGVPRSLRTRVRAAIQELPEPCRTPVSEKASVQQVLDLLFDVQERLFRWRHPEFAFEEDDEFIRVG